MKFGKLWSERLHEDFPAAFAGSHHSLDYHALKKHLNQCSLVQKARAARLVSPGKPDCVEGGGAIGGDRDEAAPAPASVQRVPDGGAAETPGEEDAGWGSPSSSLGGGAAPPGLGESLSVDSASDAWPNGGLGAVRLPPLLRTPLEGPASVASEAPAVHSRPASDAEPDLAERERPTSAPPQTRRADEGTPAAAYAAADAFGAHVAAQGRALHSPHPPPTATTTPAHVQAAGDGREHLSCRLLTALFPPARLKSVTGRRLLRAHGAPFAPSGCACGFLEHVRRELALASAFFEGCAAEVLDDASYIPNSISNSARRAVASLSRVFTCYGLGGGGEPDPTAPWLPASRQLPTVASVVRKVRAPPTLCCYGRHCGLLVSPNFCRPLLSLFTRPRQKKKARVLREFVVLNVLALRKILKKYDKLHGGQQGDALLRALRRTPGSAGSPTAILTSSVLVELVALEARIPSLFPLPLCPLLF